MTRYASSTSVSVERSREEIESCLFKYGASKFSYSTDVEQGLAAIQFQANDRHVRFVLKLSSRDDPGFLFTEAKKVRRSTAQQHKLWEQACRQRWRALLLCIKAKLEAVECEITTFEDEFMAHVVLPGGRTVGEVMKPQIGEAYKTGDIPPGIAGLLPGGE